MLKRQHMILAGALLMAAIFLFTACGDKKNEDSAGNGDEIQSAEEAGNLHTKNKNSANTTSIEAAMIAYEEARKWREDAVLWYLSPTRVSTHYNWQNSDMAYTWTAEFANGTDNTTYLVTVQSGKIKSARDVGNTRDTEVKSEYAADRPKVTMGEAGGTAVENGAPTGIMPDMIYYDIESPSFKGKPVWSIVYRVPTPDNSYELQFYFVDGLTGEFMQAAYKNDNNDIIDKSQLEVQGQDMSEIAWKQDQRHTVVKFLDLIDDGKAAEAVSMMDANMAPDETTKNAWAESFESLAGFGILGVFEDGKEEWTQDTQRFTAEIYVDESNTEAIQKYGWYPGENTRFITLKRQSGVWTIYEFGTGR